MLRNLAALNSLSNNAFVAGVDLSIRGQALLGRPWRLAGLADHLPWLAAAGQWQILADLIAQPFRSVNALVRTFTPIPGLVRGVDRLAPSLAPTGLVSLTLPLAGPIAAHAVRSTLPAVETAAGLPARTGLGTAAVRLHLAG